MSELWTLDAVELVRLVRTRAVSAREVVAAHLARIDAVNPVVNAVTSVPSESALRAAAAIDDGAEAGPLCGVPMTVKENIDVAGSATTHGIAMLRNAIVEDDAPHIAELRAAGAIPVGRGHMPEFGMRWHTDGDLHGPTRNPWSAAHTPGASSGGDAVAVATGMVPLGMGNDGAGSLRWPAQCCGVAALKTSLGRVSRVGSVAWQPAPFAFQLLAVHGPIARSVRDLRLAYTHMCGRDGGDSWYVPVPLTGPPLAQPIKVLLAVEPEADPTVWAALTRAGELLDAAGYVVEEGRLPALDRAAEIYTQLMLAHGRLPDASRPIETIVSQGFIQFWASFTPQWERAEGRRSFDPMLERAEIARAWHEMLSATPLILAPIATAPAFPVAAELDPEWLAGWPTTIRTTVVANLLGLPAVAVPIGTDSGLPQVIQLIGARFREDLCLDAATVVEAGVPALTPIDPR
ncbi:MULTISPECIES: amidase [unclassified Nocardia]|uniref:amidase n=1 Tax=unclassified Nocardia TaxID=2637762 RepID=UPI001CE4387D|nr:MULTISPECIES: amidase [unclassified Nocardia]